MGDPKIDMYGNISDVMSPWRLKLLILKIITSIQINQLVMFRSLLVFGLGVSLWLKITSREIMEYVLLPYFHAVYFSVELICTKSKRLSIKDLFTLEALPRRLKKLDMISILARLLYYILHVRSSVITFFILALESVLFFFV